jgi:hypothetical protein
VNDEEILTCAVQAFESPHDRRERLERARARTCSAVVAVGQRDRNDYDSFDALEAARGLTLDERVLRDDLMDWIGGSGGAQSA